MSTFNERKLDENYPFIIVDCMFFKARDGDAIESKACMIACGINATGECHTGADIEILKQREVKYAAAKAARPERWSGNTRDWSRPTVVMLNPDKKTDESGNKLEIIV